MITFPSQNVKLPSLIEFLLHQPVALPHDHPFARKKIIDMYREFEFEPGGSCQRHYLAFGNMKNWEYGHMISIVHASWLILGVATWIALPNCCSQVKHTRTAKHEKQLPRANLCPTRSPQPRRRCDAASTRLGRALAAWRGFVAASSPGSCAKQEEPVNPLKINHFIMGKCQFLAGCLFGFLLV